MQRLSLQAVSMPGQLLYRNAPLCRSGTRDNEPTSQMKKTVSLGLAYFTIKQMLKCFILLLSDSLTEWVQSLAPKSSIQFTWNEWVPSSCSYRGGLLFLSVVASLCMKEKRNVFAQVLAHLKANRCRKVRGAYIMFPLLVPFALLELTSNEAEVEQQMSFEGAVHFIPCFNDSGSGAFEKSIWLLDVGFSRVDVWFSYYF